METDSLRKHDLEDEDEDDVVTMSFQTTANPISSIISNVQPHDDILFSHVNPILVSSLRSEKLGLSLQWGPWESRFLNIYSNGNLIVYKNKDNNLLQQIHHWIDTFILRSSNSSTSSETNNIISILNLQDASISTLALDQDNVVTLNTSIKKEVGLYVKCKYHSGQETYIRCIIDEENLQYFRNAFDQINANNRASAISSMKSANPIPLKSFSNQKHSIMVSTQSVMRRAITHAMDTYMIQSRHDRILSRRGAFACLPVLFHNDLIHGSWWFVGGSFWMIILASVVLLNSFQDYLYGNTNDSILSRKNYEATWVLNLLAGIFFLLGSLAFVRAFHDTPPMKPLFHYYYHLQSDELLGSWLFVAASIPALPYMVIYMIEATTNQAIYLCGLVVSTLIVIGSYLFVVSSYPTDDVKKSGYMTKTAKLLFYCCCSKSWLQRNFANDWLAGSWIMYYGSLLGTFIASTMFLSQLLYHRISLVSLVYGLTWIENVFFLIGTAYFVAGSYSDTDANLEEENEDDVSTKYKLVSNDALIV